MKTFDTKQVRKQITLICIFSLCAWLSFAQSYTVDTVPNNKVLSNKLVSNPDLIISPIFEDSINVILDSLEQKTTAQVAVVLVNSIGDASEFDFAQALFDKWGIGKSGNDNGLLILFVGDKRVIRFHTGYGLEGILPDVVCKRIQTRFMVPEFKQGNVDAGMLAGVREVVKIVGDPVYAEEVKVDVDPPPVEITEEEWIALAIFFLAVPWVIVFTIIFFVKRKRGFADSENGPGKKQPTSRVTKTGWIFWYILFPPVVIIASAMSGSGLVFLGSFYGYLVFLTLAKWIRLQQSTSRLLEREQYQKLHQFYSDNKGSWIAMAILFPLPFLGLIFQYFRQRKNFRKHPRKCQTCGQKMTLLDDQAEDEYLQKSMLLEEALKSVDYDVWKCSHCSELSIEVYYNENTKYVPCPKCKTIAFTETSRRTLHAATTSSTGEREVTKECAYCHHKLIKKETIPRVVQSSSSSSSGWSGSSSSGGSFGGGRSGGGGASSSW
ncbi:MAG: TPM domain-containing protein [Bacteroidota bacterium]